MVGKSSPLLISVDNIFPNYEAHTFLSRAIPIPVFDLINSDHVVSTIELQLRFTEAQRQAGNTGRHPGPTSFSKIGFITHSQGGSPSHKRVSNRNKRLNNCGFWLDVKYKNADLSALKSAKHR